MFGFGKEKNPKGPSLKKLHLTKKGLSGTQLFIYAPAQRGSKYIQVFESTPDSFDIYKQDSYSPLKIKKKKYLGDIKSISIHKAIWIYTCPRLFADNDGGDIVLNVSVSSLDVLPAGESLFDKSIFSREIARDLQFNYFSKTDLGFSDGKYDLTEYRWPMFLAPLNWQWVKRGGVDWLYHEVQPLTGQSEYFCWYTPIGHGHFLCMQFSVSKTASNAGNSYRVAQKVNSQPFLNLIHKVMDNVEIKLSSQALEQRASVNTGDIPSPITPTNEQLKQASYVMYMSSSTGYKGKSNSSECRDHRALPEDVLAFIQERAQPNLLPGAYTVCKKLNSDT